MVNRKNKLIDSSIVCSMLMTNGLMVKNALRLSQHSIKKIRSINQFRHFVYVVVRKKKNMKITWTKKYVNWKDLGPQRAQNQMWASFERIGRQGHTRNVLEVREFERQEFILVKSKNKLR